MRGERWLKKQLQYLLKKYFSDIKITNPVEIKFGREAKYRFGSIRLIKPKLRRLGRLRVFRELGDLKPQKSIITITSMFKDESIPEEVVDYTIAHELCHYAHGFSSTNKRLFKHPHHGGIVNSELTKRGAADLIKAFKIWLKDYREQIRHRRIKL